MTGWRVGYGIFPETILDKALIFSQNTITHVNTFCQLGALTAIQQLKKNQTVLSQMFALYKARYEYLLALLTEKKIRFLEPEGAFYFFIHCGQPSVEFAKDLLEQEKIAVVPGLAYGKGFHDYYRMSFAVDQKSFDRFVSWIGDS
jgi:aspartate/methionine/tyrosine aminotransferase